MFKYINNQIQTDKYPNVLTHVYYLMISATFCYLYYHKFINRADFYGPDSPGGVYAVLDFTAVKPIQFRMLVPFIFKAFKTVIFLVQPISDKQLFFIITIIFCYLIILSFYLLLNEYFASKRKNSWLAPVIIYPMIWNFVIMNGQFFFMDFTLLLVIIVGFFCIVSGKYPLLLLVFFLGLFNHPSVGYLIPAFLFFNYNKLFKLKTILYTLVMCILYFATYKIMDQIFQYSNGYFVIFNLPRNLKELAELPIHIIGRDLFFNFGGVHVFIIVLILSGFWKKFRGPYLYINFIIIIYIVSILVSFSIEEIRNYIAIIPFVLMLTLLYLSSLGISFLKPIDKICTQQN